MMSDCPLLEVLGNKQPGRRPVWLMRQAGRYLPEYREVRAKAGSFLGLCYNPEWACEVTLQPLRRYDLDAAILFSDILVVPHAMGLALDFVEGEGPKLQTVGSMAEVEALEDGFDSEPFRKVCETVGLVKQGLRSSVGFIGFCGAPWTVASYMIEGGGSDRKRAVAVAVENPQWFGTLIDRLVETSIQYLLGQITAGVQAVQIFDSWAGDIPESVRKRVVSDPIARIAAGVRAVHTNFPVIVFARGVSSGHGQIAKETLASAVGVEQGVALRDVIAALPSNVAVQGNLPPEMLRMSALDIEAGCRAVMDGVPMARHIFNLGHGITPDVKPEAVQVMLDAIRRYDHV